MSTAFPQVDLSQNAGRVVVSDVHAGTLVQPGAPGVASGPTARITDSAAVLLDGCRLRGLNPAYIAAVSGGAQSGLRVTGSRVWIADTRVQGAEGGYSNTCGSSGTSGPGATALVATASTLVLARSTVIGGDGGAHDDCFEPNFGVGFDGGDGIALLASELLLAGGPGNSVVGGTTTWWHPFFGPNPTVGAGVLVDGTSRARAATDAVVVSGGGFVGTVGPDGAFEVLAGGRARAAGLPAADGRRAASRRPASRWRCPSRARAARCTSPSGPRPSARRRRSPASESRSPSRSPK